MLIEKCTILVGRVYVSIIIMFVILGKASEFDLESDFDNLRYQSLSISIALSVYLIYLPTINPRIRAPFPLPLKPISDFTNLLLFF